MAGLAVGDPQSITSDFGTLLSIALPFGILPLAVGILLVRWGVRKDRERRNARPRDGNG
jgi:hypothetical protein